MWKKLKRAVRKVVREWGPSVIAWVLEKATNGRR